MKKIFLSYLIMLFSFFCFAEEKTENNTTINETTQNSVEDERNGITGFYGIQFKTKKDEVKKIMKEKGWKQCDKGNDKNFGDYLTFKNGIYATKKISGYDTVTFYFYEDYYYSTTLAFHIDRSMKQDKKEEEEKWVKNVLKGTIDKYNLHELSQSKKSIQYTGENKNIFTIVLNSTQYTDWYYFRYTDTVVYLAKSLNKSITESKEAEKITNSSDL